MSADLRTPSEWAALLDLYIMDPDGWRMDGAPAWDEPISRAEFDMRAGMSTTGPLSSFGVMTPETIVRVPNQPRTPLKSFRIPEELYRAAQVRAAERGESVSEVVRKALERYVRRK